MIQALWTLLFPPKCVLCGGLLEKEETDLCHNCRLETRKCQNSRKRIPFVAHWTALWYYEENVRQSLLRFKFSGRRSYAVTYGRLLAMHLSQNDYRDTDVLTWVPVSRLRKLKRRYDQVELLAQAVGRELEMQPVPLLKKVRHNAAQSTLSGMSQRKANVLNAYKAIDPGQIAGKRILLLDDIITTGATVSECARVLMTAGAKEVICAAVAVNPYER